MCCCVSVCKCVYVYVRSAHGCQKRASDLLVLQLLAVVNHSVGTGNQTLVLCKNSMHSLTAEPSKFEPVCATIYEKDRF